ncbi:MAG: hypothetical protein FWE63_07315 [Bacteroidales bacterium]|nr:hypothetical protein [Bacteroidales bacterium]
MYKYILAFLCLPLVVACNRNNTTEETADLILEGNTVVDDNKIIFT